MSNVTDAGKRSQCKVDLERLGIGNLPDSHVISLEAGIHPDPIASSYAKLRNGIFLDTQLSDEETIEMLLGALVHVIDAKAR